MFFFLAVNNIDFSRIGIDVTDIYIWAGIILAAIGAIWGIRKMILLAYESNQYDEDNAFIGATRDKYYYYEDGEIHSDDVDDLNIGWNDTLHERRKTEHL